jgi:folate-dependent tRNA-U54 methylase TrmFO/GidA
MESFTGVKVFSTTLARDREHMGETINRWLEAHRELEVVKHEVRQSSDKEFHCLTITFFYRERGQAT